MKNQLNYILSDIHSTKKSVFPSFRGKNPKKIRQNTLPTQNLKINHNDEKQQLSSKIRKAKDLICHYKKKRNYLPKSERGKKIKTEFNQIKEKEKCRETEFKMVQCSKIDRKQRLKIEKLKTYLPVCRSQVLQNEKSNYDKIFVSKKEKRSKNKYLNSEVRSEKQILPQSKSNKVLPKFLPKKNITQTNDREESQVSPLSILKLPPQNRKNILLFFRSKKFSRLEKREENKDEFKLQGWDSVQRNDSQLFI